MRTRVVIMGAAGRDFHVFNVVFRARDDVRVVAFTATQIPGIESRRYPAELAGPAYPDGIPIVSEGELEKLIEAEQVDRVVFAYSDVSHETVMHAASRVLAAGPDFELLGPDRTMVRARTPVIAVCAVRTGAGKSQTSRFVVGRLKEAGVHPVVVRHPMPYGDLVRQRVQRFASLEDLDRAQTTIEEREDYEPHIRAGTVVFAGVDYEEVLRAAEAEGDVIVWDGGNNDFSFVRPDLEITVVDPLRAGHETTYHPGEVNLRRADVIIINKVGSATPEQLSQVREAIARANPKARVILIDSVLSADGVVVEGPGGDRPDLSGRRVLVIEDGPTVTHGGMPSGAGLAAARLLGAEAVVDPRTAAVGHLRDVFAEYPHVGPVLPAVGYFPEQLRDLEATIAACAPDIVASAAPLDLSGVLRLDVPVVRVSYEVKEADPLDLTAVITGFVTRHCGAEGGAR